MTPCYGYVQDAQTGETLIGATIKMGFRPTGTSTNRYGFFSLSAPAADFLLVSCVGYQSKRLHRRASSAGPITVRLVPNVAELDAVTVKQSTGKDTYDDATMERFVVPLDIVKKAPALLGSKPRLTQLFRGASELSSLDLLCLACNTYILSIRNELVSSLRPTGIYPVMRRDREGRCH
ncbi:carboxypeptidase-like regulatory domain-containing protein [Fibrella forsythiae]|uniref:Carboxypeptidase-like regulatory domain-containing protein n=1 Tax=Fibrella forsythiae TaxID=2817061 RepID=A0ABS3JF59_9BACT|nr:carboxypeptidase-like regulatory domain-containing protein [Fibrella forsythiae]MBO0948627.1 carboxypeptidase-like regulatory domain-containing protein [Fibrella forsythiae]